MREERDKQKAHLRVCGECDLLQKTPELQAGQLIRCVRCQSIIEKKRYHSLDRSLALVLTGLILFFLSNMFPLLTLKAQGVEFDTNLIASSIELLRIDRPFLAILVFVTTIVVPMFSLFGMLFVFMSVKMRWHNEYVGPIFRYLHNTQVWGMLEVFLLAIMVAGVKLADLAEVIPGISLYSFFALILVLATLGSTLSPDEIWDHEREAQL
ncbi:MAG: Paraquat-inducible protein A [uncultured Thiotrichaceae bacterium]|uniref:Paraquat-inducible protein A n=1 Tax=uncultured Thiotrichaceae bacterium TaxID=298394 RepID=A0A6S6T0N4_9GAMM|nr:MAG: Paraquat-inducible protein A [uncultured Thiotrichaceae bacterium]